MRAVSVTYRCRNLKKMKTFYTRVLGWEVTEEGPNFCYLDTGGLTLGLVVTLPDTWDAPTGEFTIRYEPSWDALEARGNEKLMLYAKYARGFKGGHFNAGLTIANNEKSQSLKPVKPEYIHAAEVGFEHSNNVRPP